LAARRADGRLRSLTVEGFGLIDKTAVVLGPGLNAFTGETGTGKSMVIDALGFAFGDRAGPDVVRAGSARAAVFVEFEPGAHAHRWVEENGFDEDDDVVVVSRDVQAQGRSSARINGKPATASQLRELGDLMLDVVGQNEHANLAKAGSHLALLDDFAGDAVAGLRASVSGAHHQVRLLRAELEALRSSEASAERRLADARYAADEITAARLSDGEIEEIKERRARLANSARILQALSSASAALDAEDAGATSSLGRAAAALEQISRYGAAFKELAENAAGLQSAASELSASIASSALDGAGDPSQLDVVEDRLAAIERLQKKYGSTVPEILAAGERFEREARALFGRDDEIARLEREFEARDADLRRDAAALTKARKAAAVALARHVAVELGSLGMSGATFRCGVDPRPDGIGPSGADRVEFFASLNPNEPERPIAKAASGGELSRLLLALKVALGDVDPHPVVVLDEIDSGVGGAAARAVGARIAALARSVQVLCVTHLAQIAAFADQHIVLDKKTVAGRVVIEARVLDGSEDTRTEIARMLSGDARGAEALKHADALIRDVKTPS
jgi:DNA repair protein RecN (Recombination protein N)